MQLLIIAAAAKEDPFLIVGPDIRRRIMCHGIAREKTGPSSCGQKNIIYEYFIIDPRGRPQSLMVVITIFTQSVRPSVLKLQNQATITAGRDCGLTEWIIDDSCLISSCVARDRETNEASSHGHQISLT